MPRATIDAEARQRFDLETLPGGDGEEDGWVELRSLDYGQMLQRRDMAAKMAVEAPDGQGGNPMDRATIEIIQRKVTEFEFATCVTDHNLEDANGQKLNFKFPQSVASLQPVVGAEISKLIDGMNQDIESVEGKVVTPISTDASEQA
jgi:hypothetical protein